MWRRQEHELGDASMHLHDGKFVCIPPDEVMVDDRVVFGIARTSVSAPRPAR